MRPTDDDQTLAMGRLRRTLLLLAHNQSEQQHREAAGRHVAALGAAMRVQATGERRQAHVATA